MTLPDKEVLEQLYRTGRILSELEGRIELLYLLLAAVGPRSTLGDLVEELTPAVQRVIAEAAKADDHIYLRRMVGQMQGLQQMRFELDNLAAAQGRQEQG